MSFRKKVFDIFDEKNEAEHPLNKPVSLGIIILIILSVISVILESDAYLNEKYKSLFYNFEVFAVIIFTVEYLARLWTADLIHPGVSKLRAAWKFVISPMAIIDFLAILPFYMEMLQYYLAALGIAFIDLRFIRVLRLMRLLRIFKLSRYSSSLQLIGAVLKEEKEKLLITIFMTMILLVLASALIYTTEHEVQAEAFPNIYSSMWWAIATLTTVGYGDVYPVTAFGKLLAGVIALLGIGLVALPTGILSSSFVQRLQEGADEKQDEDIDELEKDVENIEREIADIKTKVDPAPENLSIPSLERAIVNANLRIADLDDYLTKACEELGVSKEEFIKKLNT